MQAMEKVVSVCIIPAKWSALLQAAAATLLEKVFVESMVHGGSVLRRVAMMVLKLVVSAASTVPNQSALGNGAPRPSNQGEGVSSTAAAVQKRARLMDATPLLHDAVSARSMVRLESASLQAALLGCHLLKNHIALRTAEAR